MRISPMLANKLRARVPVLPAAAAIFPPGTSFTAPVLSVPDGDGLDVWRSGKRVKIRLYGCDAPEYGQYYARQAWFFLRNLIWGKPVTCQIMDKDVYGRLVCDCYGNSQHSFSLLLILYGYAWHYDYYAPDAHHLRDAQRLAKLNRRGLWQRDNPTPPWHFRHSKKQKEHFHAQ